MNNRIPGYGGYVRLFQREAVTINDPPAHKYEDYSAPRAVEVDSMRRFPWQSVYTHSIAHSHVVDNYKKRTAPLPAQRTDDSLPQQQAGIKEADSGGSGRGSVDDNTVLRGGNAHHKVWKSTYRDTYGQSAERAMSAPTSSSAQLPPLTHINYQSDPLPAAHNLLRSTHGMASAYTRDFGKPSSNPLDRFQRQSSQPQFEHNQLSKTATTRELFAGTNKSSQRIVGYEGFVPAAERNRSSIVGDASNPNKDNILAVYRHDMPGYTGHKPSCVLNERGPRTPRGKRRLHEGLHASLVLDSMRI